jgi:nitroreductase
LFDELFQKLKDNDFEPKKFLQEGTFRFYGAPVIILVFMDGSIGKRYFFDIGTCVQNVLLAAQAEGLGTHLIGLILKFQNTIKKTLQISSDKRLVVGICLGYPDLENPINNFKPKRETIDQSVMWIGL